MVYIARATGFLPDQFFINNSVKIGFLIEGLILMAALIKRTKDEWDNSTKALEEKNRELVYLSTVASESENGIAIIDPNGTIEW